MSGSIKLIDCKIKTSQRTGNKYIDGFGAYKAEGEGKEYAANQPIKCFKAAIVEQVEAALAGKTPTKENPVEISAFVGFETDKDQNGVARTKEIEVNGEKKTVEIKFIDIKAAAPLGQQPKSPDDVVKGVVIDEIREPGKTKTEKSAVTFTGLYNGRFFKGTTLEGNADAVAAYHGKATKGEPIVIEGTGFWKEEEYEKNGEKKTDRFFFFKDLKVTAEPSAANVVERKERPASEPREKKPQVDLADAEVVKAEKIEVEGKKPHVLLTLKTEDRGEFTAKVYEEEGIKALEGVESGALISGSGTESQNRDKTETYFSLKTVTEVKPADENVPGL